MAALRYRDEHNKVGYLQKPKGSDDYHQILDFLGASHIRYALTHDPIIFDSLVKQFWSTATLGHGVGLSYPATLHKTPVHITEESGMVSNIAQFGGANYATLDAMLSQAQEGEGAGADVQAVPPPIPETIPETRHESDHSQDHKVHSLETKLKAHKKLFKDVVPKLVKKVKALEVKFKTKKRKVVLSDSDKEDGGEEDVDLDALNALANAAVTIDSTKSPGGPSKNHAACSYDPTSDVPSTYVPTNVPSGVASTGPSTVSPGSTTVPTSSSVPAAETIPARSGTTTVTPSSPVRDARRERCCVKNYSTQVNTFKLNWMMNDWLGVRKLSPEQLQEEFDKIQRAVAFTRGLKRYGSPMTNASLKKLKTGDVEVDNIPEAQVEVPSQEATVEDVEVPSNIASKAQQTASSLKKVGTKKKLLGRKGVHTSQSTIPIEEGDPDAEHKLCIKYASDEDSASDCDTPVHLYAVVDWELLPTGLGSINAIYRLDNSRKYFTSLREILHLVTRADLMTIYGRVMTFYQDKKAEGVGLVLWGDLKILMDSPEVNDGSDFWKNQHTWSIQNWKLYSFSGVHVLETVSGLVIHMFVDKKYPLTINLIERMLDHQLEICHGTVGNELTTAVQLIAFLKKQISDSKRPKVHEWVINSPCYHNKELASPEQTATAEVVPKSVAGSSFSAASSMYVVPTGRVVVLAGRYIVPVGKVILIVSTGRLSLVPTSKVLSPGRVK
ncbi:hypothetical protein Tco_0150925 [Tanacetum coccineum]